MANKRELVLKAFNNEPVERVPVGFWFHFAAENEFGAGLADPAVVEKNIAGHQKFYDSFKPDFVKLMSDGFFAYPAEGILEAEKAADLFALQPLGAGHPWIEGQVELVKELTGRFGSEVLTFYNVFAPLTYVKLLRDFTGRDIAGEFYKEDKRAFAHLLDVVATDLATLAKRVIGEGGADGIYLSVQEWPAEGVTGEEYLALVGPSDKKVLAAANEAGDVNILHICGYEGSRNSLETFKGYEAKAVNWAVVVEGVSLAEGKKLFGGRAVIGGFDNRPGGLLHAGTREGIEAYTEQLLADAGQTGVILGADCTVPGDIDVERLDWVREKAASLKG